eukprot:3599-Chlamydomonas_euryale.AAC.1
MTPPPPAPVLSPPTSLPQTCDPDDLAVDPRLPTPVSWSVGVWPFGHGRNRGVSHVCFGCTLDAGPIALCGAAAADADVGADAEVLVLTLAMPNVTLSEAETDFQCVPMRVADGSRRHIIAFEVRVCIFSGKVSAGWCVRHVR